jgi:hypothetical protein
VGHTVFWLAQVQRKSRVDAADGDSAVPFRAEKADPGWDISRGKWILNIRWLQRVRVKVFKQAGEKVLALTSQSCLCGLSGTRQRQTSTH